MEFRCAFQEKLHCIIKKTTVFKTVVSLTATIVLVFVFIYACNKNEVTRWKHFTIADPLPGTELSSGVGGIPPADFDGDGDLDVAISRGETKTAYWYERKSDAEWIQHTIGSAESIEFALGTAALDIDQDGWIDVASNMAWFKNPRNLADNPDAPWQVNSYSCGGHDIIAADINRDGHLDIVTYDTHDGTGEQEDLVKWYDTSNGLKQTSIGGGYKHHGGIAPRGAGDLDGDGDLDIVIPGHWFENPGDGYGDWIEHDWPHTPVQNATFGPSIRSWIADINNDGENDIVYGDCDTGQGHVYWIENLGKGTGWKQHKLQDPPTAEGDVPGTGSYHSLCVADFDMDGDLDIFGGEQEDPTVLDDPGVLPMKPAGLKERGVMWENSGAEKPSFKVVVIQLDNPGWHDAEIGDVDGDGDFDIVTKIWSKDGPTLHADYWRNETIKRTKQ